MDKKYHLALPDVDRVRLIDDKINFMMIKPEGMPAKTEILFKIGFGGFTVLYGQDISINRDQITYMNKEAFEKIRANPKLGDAYVNEYIAYMQSSPVCAMITYNRNPNTIDSIIGLKGSKPKGADCESGSIRKDFFGAEKFNSFHASSGIKETCSNIQIFFPQFMRYLS